MAQKYKYIYNIKTGHYIKKLNEEDDNVSNDISKNTKKEETPKEQPKDPSKETVNQQSYMSVESDDKYKKITAAINDENKKYETDNAALIKKLAAAKQAAETSSSATGAYDHISTDSNVLTIEKQMLTLKKQHNDKIYNLENQKLNILQSLATATVKSKETSERIYAKYKNLLNESNIHTAKVYVNNLVGNTDNHILKGMNDFKRCLKDSNLLYGKDPNGFFIICVDQEDFDNMYDSLQEVGYLRDQIIDTVMPQLFNRQAMIQ